MDHTAHGRLTKGNKMRSVQEIRTAANGSCGQENVRITRAGELHIYGTMPNTNVEGWYFGGYVGSESLERELFEVEYLN